MVRFARAALLAVVILFCIFVLAACGSTGASTPPPPPPPSVQVTVSPTSVSMTASASQTITATVANATNSSVTWGATAGTITGSGNTITYSAPANAGTYSVTATSAADSSKSASTIVTVTAAPPPPGVSVSVSPQAMSLVVSGTQSVTATVTGSSNTAVTWTMTGGTITGSGNTVTYNAPASTGTFNLTATSVADTTKSASAVFTVTAAPPPTISISPLSATLAPGGQQQFIASSSQPGATYVWSASAGIFTGSGSTVVYTAPNTAGNYSVSVAISGSNATPASAGVTVASNTAFGMTIPQAHPRLWFNAARIAQAKTWYNAHPFTPNNPFDVAWVHVLNGSDCSSAVNWANTFTPPAAEVSPSGNGSDSLRVNGEVAILIFDWCNDQFTAAQKTTFISNWNTWLGGVQHQNWGGPTMYQDNYFWGNVRNEFDWGVASYWENTTPATSFLQDSLQTRWTNSFLPTALPGGVSYGGLQEEGTSYGVVMLTYMIIPFQTAANLGRDMASETPFFKQSIFQVLYNTMPSETWNKTFGLNEWMFSDFNDVNPYDPGDQGGILRSRDYYQDWLTWSANYWSSNPTGSFARQLLNTVTTAPSRSAYPFYTANDSGGSATAFNSLPLDYFGSGENYFVGRKAWDTSSMVTVWQMGIGSGVGHQHEDYGNFQIWRAGRWLVRESSGYSQCYTDYNNGPCADSQYTEAHNSIFVNGHRAAAPIMFLPDQLRLESQPGYSYAAVDLTGVFNYDVDHGNLDFGLNKFIREFLFVRSLDTLVVFDRIQTVDSSYSTGVNAKKTFLAHFENAPTLEDSNHLNSVNGSQTVRMTTLLPASATYRVINEAGCAGCSASGQYRVEIDTSGAQQSYFLHVFQARDNTAGNITASVVDSNPSDPNSGTFTVTLHSSGANDTTIVLQKGQLSTGGSINLGGAGVTALRSNVQGVTIGDSGPVWQP